MNISKCLAVGYPVIGTLLFIPAMLREYHPNNTAYATIYAVMEAFAVLIVVCSLICGTIIFYKTQLIVKNAVDTRDDKDIDFIVRRTQTLRREAFN